MWQCWILMYNCIMTLLTVTLFYTFLFEALCSMFTPLFWLPIILPVLITWSSLFCLREKKVHPNCCCHNLVNPPSIPSTSFYNIVIFIAWLLFGCLPTFFVGRQKFLFVALFYGFLFWLLYFVVVCSFSRRSVCIICEIRGKCFTSRLTPIYIKLDFVECFSFP